MDEVFITGSQTKYPAASAIERMVIVAELLQKVDFNTNWYQNCPNDFLLSVSGSFCHLSLFYLFTFVGFLTCFAVFRKAIILSPPTYFVRVGQVGS